ncbi:MAG: hypothetical protein K8T90_16175 [Planctomycetes bacterium]|nr:hypothetical protein [Planctomycetota bacterium]
MSDSDDDLVPVPRAPRPWVAVAFGTSTGLLAAAVGVTAWSAWKDANPPTLPPVRAVAQIDIFRLPSGGAREAMLIPAGPDATGEPRLAGRLFAPGAPRELVSLVLANVSPREIWDIDLAVAAPRCRVGSDDWAPIDVIDGHHDLASADALRLRSLGAGDVRLRLEPGTLREVLLALPPGRKLSDLTDVEWEGRPLAQDRLELERIRRFREDPAGTTTGR